MAETALPTGVLERPRPTGWRRIFLGTAGLRAGWSFLLFAGLYTLLGAGLTYGLQALAHGLPEGWTPWALSSAEAVSLLAGLATLFVLGRVEGRSFAAYGLPFRAGLPHIGRRFGEGALWGLAANAATVLAIAAAGGYALAGLALHGEALVQSAVLWGLAFLLIGISEEIVFRSFPLFTLSRGLGFWPGAVLLSAFFGALHYFTKPMETWMDGVSVSLIGLFFCLTVRRTGDLWFAMGYHFTWNFTSMAVFGSPNTGNLGRPIANHLLAGTFHGPAWLTGGPMGVEASALVFPVTALVYGLFLRRFRTVQFPLQG
ncbi:MAG TPA: type II CAAX endopeptidase family protein [Thermoanaerobaculia bacterium]|nr:type II CAAX endopeptidase family protein [Thermoanaerobaculia bacterium]